MPTDSSSETLGKLLLDRLRTLEELDDDITAEFVDARPGTVLHWRTNARAGYPKGEKLNKLWYFLDAIGLDSPELYRLSPFHRYIGELHAYGIVRLLGVDAGDDFSLCDLLGVKNEQDALRVLRGVQTPARPLVGKIEGQSELDTSELEKIYGEQLDKARAEWAKRFIDIARLRGGKRLTPRYLPVKPVVTEPATPKEQAPMTTETPDVPETEVTFGIEIGSQTVVPASPPVLTSDDSEPSQAADADAEPRRRKRTRPSRAPKQSTPTLNGQKQPPNFTVPTLDNSAQMFALADRLASIIPLLNYALSDKCTDEERAFMRQMLGQENLHHIRMSLIKLTSTRAFRERP